MKTDYRKLAAVMFTDLEGSTTMFQTNEDSALDKIHLHRRQLDEITQKHDSQIMQFYGDGCLIINDSAIDAIRCALELQKASIESGIPLRIGIHLGEVIYEGQHVFGDSINVASRIQSEGIAGAILVSKKVTDEVKNHPELSFVRLGDYVLKNVSEKLQLFALNVEGLKVPPVKSVPQKIPALLLYGMLGLCVLAAYIIFKNPKFFHNDKASISNERIVIPPFIDLTAKKEYGFISELASSLITHDLSETSDADIVSVSNALLYSNADISAMLRNPALARQTGAANMIKGSYSLTGARQDSLVFWASVLNTTTLKELSVAIPKKYCKASDPMQCIREMSMAIKGFWSSRDDHPFTIPDYDAYLAYLNAKKLWASPDPKIQEKAKDYLIQAISFDTSFLDAYFLLLEHFNNHGEYANEADTIALIRRRFPDLSARKENFLKMYEEELLGRHAEAYQYFMNEYKNDPEDLFLNTRGMVMALESLNNPDTALLFERFINSNRLDLLGCAYCRTKANMALMAYTSKGKVQEATLLAKNMTPNAVKAVHYTSLILFHMAGSDTASVNRVIKNVADRAVPKAEDQQYACLMAARYALIYNQPELSQYYAEKAISLYQDTITRTFGRCHYMKGNFDEAEKIFLKLAEKKYNKGLYADLGCVYAKKGDKQKADQIIKDLESKKEKYDFGQTAYFQGRIKAVMGDENAALDYLGKALDEGINFRTGTTFQHDPDLLSLRDNPSYLQLVSRLQ